MTILLIYNMALVTTGQNPDRAKSAYFGLQDDTLVLLVSSGLYEWLRIPYIDVIGSLAIAVLSFREGREAYLKARSDSLACGDDCCG